jgi:hypothetical protein
MTGVLQSLLEPFCEPSARILAQHGLLLPIFVPNTAKAHEECHEGSWSFAGRSGPRCCLACCLWGSSLKQLVPWARTAAALLFV